MSIDCMYDNNQSRINIKSLNNMVYTIQLQEILDKNISNVSGSSLKTTCL